MIENYEIWIYVTEIPKNFGELLYDLNESVLNFVFYFNF